MMFLKFSIYFLQIFIYCLGYSIHYRKNGEKWHEISIPDSSQTSYTLTNLDAGEPYQLYVTSIGPSGISEPSEIATVRTSSEAICMCILFFESLYIYKAINVYFLYFKMCGILLINLSGSSAKCRFCEVSF